MMLKPMNACREASRLLQLQITCSTLRTAAANCQMTAMLPTKRGQASCNCPFCQCPLIVCLPPLAALYDATPVSMMLACTPFQVLRRFASASLVAAPCFADEARTRFLGFLDLMDVVAAVVDAARHQGPGTPTAGSDIGGGSTCLSRHSLAARCRSGVARELAEQPVSALRATSNDAQLVYQAQLSNNLLQVRQSSRVA